MKLLFFTIICGFLNFYSFSQPCKKVSGAPIGTASTWALSPSSLMFSHPVSGESLTVNSFVGSPTTVYIYRVDMAPKIYSGTCSNGSMINTMGVPTVNDRYFGVFVVGGSSPSYNVIYNYNGNPYVTSSNELDLSMATRLNNEINLWNTIGSLDLFANTVSVTNETSRKKEYDLTVLLSLSIELESFSIDCINGNKILNWVTNSEKNNDYFIVQRSFNGKDWDNLDTISGAGTTQISQKYTFIDETEVFNLAYYRLKQVDFDGKFVLSEIIGSNCCSDDLKILPNPSEGIFKITFQDNDKDVEYFICDAGGRIILKGICNNNLLEINLECELNGIYYLTLLGTSPTIQNRTLKLYKY